MKAWMISKKELAEIEARARREALLKHPKQARRRFDAMNERLRDGIVEQSLFFEFESFAQLEDAAGIVIVHKENLGTKKWADYRTAYVHVIGKIEDETEKSVKFCGTWYRKEKIFAVVRDWDF